jgi:hypothetical protein
MNFFIYLIFNNVNELTIKYFHQLIGTHDENIVVDDEADVQLLFLQRFVKITRTNFG